MKKEMAFAVIAIMLVATSAAFADAANQGRSKNSMKAELKNEIKADLDNNAKAKVKLQQDKNLEPPPGVIPEKWLFNRHHFVGKGVAIPVNDSSSVKYVKMTINAKTNPKIMAPCTDEGCIGAVIKGKLNLEGDILDIRNVTFGNKTVSGKLYRNETLVGSFDLAKGDWFNVWHGNLNVDGKSYTLFIVRTQQYHWKWRWPVMIEPAEVEED